MATLNAEHINPFLMAAKKGIAGHVLCRCCNTKADTEGSKI